MILTCTLLSSTVFAQNSPTVEAGNKNHFRITVNGIFPESPDYADKRFQGIDLSSEDDEVIDSKEVAVSLSNSALKPHNEPKLRLNASHAKRGKAYTVNGKRYVPFAKISEFSQEGVASWYGPGFHGRKTANGESYNQHALTAAHKELPLNSVVKVTRVSTGKSVIVRINDRGPFHGNRVIDLSYAAAKKLGIDKKGSDKVKIELVNHKAKKNIL
ncbi:septal ring lytic transglycosylase RlpA family protein [Pelistega sp. NLN82]|uniref:Endolytic peptidoglycan transglycosylase RlpA n=2 Tax=Pelistega ratti TaxID=2652177 RepID=A0A6L9Y412_9BURK|nr:septal ring lytic transglycosylase RlpA family protein [Pelistega ratti]